VLKLSLILLLPLLSSCLNDNLDTDKPTRVLAPAGTFVGRDQGAVLAFKGIPYAGPVDGDQRWLPPVPAALAGAEFSANEFGRPCFHINEPMPDKRSAEDFVGSSDCLHLNLWVPKLAPVADQKTALPVMVFFHGGAFEVGSADWKPFGLRFYDGAKLAASGEVIVLTFNYRLGAFGFLRHEELNGSHGANPGVLDQLLALRWVKQNIAAFGGDPSNVTAFGQSAGAVSICNLLTMAQAENLFHKAILQSGSCAMLAPERAAETTAQILKKLECSSNDLKGQADCLRSAEDKNIVTAQPSLTLGGGQLIRLKFAPIVDGVTINDSPDAVIKSQKHMQIPILIGTNAQEVPVWLQPDSKDAWEGVISALAKKGSETAAQRVKTLYEEQNRHGSYKNLIADLKTDLSFTCKARYFAKLFAANQSQPVRLYLFDKQIPWVGAWVHGSFHGLELFYLFQHVPKWAASFAGPGFELQKTLAALWTNFAKTGQLPENDWTAEWKPYSSEHRTAGVLGDFFGILDDPRKQKCELLEEFMLSDGEMGLLK
jgi:para-nitrobenzyl esterase